MIAAFINRNRHRMEARYSNIWRDIWPLSRVYGDK